MNALTLCNNCDSAEALKSDPRGYCAECVYETDRTPRIETITIEVTQKQLEDLIRALDYGQMHLHQLDATIGGNTEVNEAWRDRSERFGRLRKYLLWA